MEHPEVQDTFAYPGPPYAFSGTPWRIRRRAPLLGEDNERVLLGDLGLSRDEVVLLRESGVV